MQLITYLNFDGQCEEAFQFYHKVLGGELAAMMTFGETPAKDFVPAESHGQIMHARLNVKGQVLMGSDSTAMHPYQGVKGASVALVLKDASEGERLFNALSQNGAVEMPFQETFWAVRFGSFTDQFGVPWLINVEKTA